MLSLKERAISNERFVGMTVKDIFKFKKEVIADYANLQKEIFGEKVDMNDNSLVLHKASDIQTNLLEMINDKVKKSGKEFRLTTLNKSATEQITKFYVNKYTNDILDYIKSLCSEEEFEMVKKELESEMSLEDEDMFKDIEASNDIPLIQQVDYLISELDTQFKDIKANIKSSFELEKDVKENSKAGQEAAKNFKDSANFTPSPQQPVDVDFEPVGKESVQDDKKELLNMIEECTNYYYNINRVTAMIGGQTAILKNVMDNILVYCNNMNKLVDDLYGKESNSEIKTKLSNMQIELAKMICAYNPNNKNDMNTVINSFKAIQVDQEGKPVVYEDFFGNTINVNDIKPNTNNTQTSNPKVSSKLLVKYPEMIPLIRKISQMGIEIDLKEIKSGYKNNTKCVVRADLSIEGNNLNKPLIIDTEGVLFNDDNKVILLESNIIEDSIVLDLKDEELIQKYIHSNISNDELLKHDKLDKNLRILSRVVDLSSMTSEQRKTIVNVLLQKPSKVVLNEAVQYDEDVRFKLSKWTDVDDFELISNSTVKSTFLGTTNKRKKQIIKFIKGELAVGR